MKMGKQTNSARNRRGETRRLKFEALETRRLLAVDAFAEASAFGDEADVVETVSETAGAPGWWILTSDSLDPSAEEQELLEQINRFRADPQGELDRIFSVANDQTLDARNDLIDAALGLYQYPLDSVETFLNEWRAISPSAPLAFNASLQAAAQTHNNRMIAANAISHQLTGEKDLATRVLSAGFETGLTTAVGTPALSENVGGAMTQNGEFSVASYALASFAVDWGVPSHSHRDALTNGDYTEIGIALTPTSKQIGPYATTCDLGTSVDGARSDGAYLLGVVYDDLDGDAFYDVGEGVGGAKITIERLDGDFDVLTVEISSMSAGGYQIFLLNGSYRITVEGGAFSTSVVKNVAITDGVNKKLDFRSTDAGAVVPIVDLNGDEAGTGWNAVFVEGAETAVETLGASKVTISDPDSPYLFGAKIYLTERPNGVDETLDIFVAGTDLRASFDEQGGFISLSGTGTIAEYEEAIASLTYFNASELCDLTDRTVAISVFDGVYWSDEAILTIAITPTILPNMTVGEMIAYEGDVATQIATFAVELDAPARVDVSFNYRVVVGSGTAAEGEAFIVPIGEPIAIPAGETSATIDCYIIGNFDALKPEGLAAVEGGFENPSTYFYLEIVDLKNAYLTNENALVKGTIFDDDSPIVLGTVSQYEFASALSTDAGRRRYVYSLTPETSGYFAWSAETLDLPSDLSISVRKETLDSVPIALSEATENGQKVQWFADPSVEYLITIEAASEFGNVAAKLLPILEESVLLVDPLLANADEALLELFWTDDGGGFGLAVDDFTWSFDANFWDSLGGLGAAFPTIKTENFSNAEFAFYLPADGGGSVGANDDGGTTWKSDSGGGLNIFGFGGVTYWGKGERENLSFVGSNGDDYLYYAGGFGYFNVGKATYRFNNVNTVTVDAGSAGNDVALIEDSAFDDALKTTNSEFGLYGGGFALVGKNFTDAKINFVNGGVDSYFAQDAGDDASAVVAKTASIVSGTFLSTVQNLETGENETVARVYRRVVAKSAETTFSPDGEIGAVSYYGDDSSGAYFDAEIGALTAFDLETNATTTVYRAKTLTLDGVPEGADERLNVATPTGDFSVSENEQYVSITDSRGWTLAVPFWKKITKTSSAVASETLESVATRQNVFAEWSDFDDEIVDEEENALVENRNCANVSNEILLPAVEADDLFETLNSIKSDETEELAFWSARRGTK